MIVSSKRLSRITCLGILITLFSCETLSQLGSAIDLGNPTDSEINSGLKQALEYGTTYASEQLSKEDGYFGNMAIRIVFPEEAKKLESTLRSIGLGSVCDKVILSVNRAAEDAAKEAKPIFVDAIKQMSIADVRNILLGKDDAATTYFKQKTTASLESKFQPIIASSLNKVGATKYWAEVINRYNKIPLTSPVEADLSRYVTNKAIDGLFFEIAEEELKIRNNAAARSTLLLQKVFGYAEKQGS